MCNLISSACSLNYCFVFLDKYVCSICNRFLSKYPEYPKRNEFIEISLDDVAKDLSKKDSPNIK